MGFQNSPVDHAFVVPVFPLPNILTYYLTRIHFHPVNVIQEVNSYASDTR